MNTDKKYNGWTNWETWSFNLHWDNNFTEDAQRSYDDAEADSTFTKEENAAFSLIETIKSCAEEMLDMEPVKNPWIQDIVSGYMSEVNFHEIAKAYIDSVEKEEIAA
jgi:hypothetical protein